MRAFVHAPPGPRRGLHGTAADPDGTAPAAVTASFAVARKLLQTFEGGKRVMLPRLKCPVIALEEH